jgi:transcription initiation factor TFIIIB Brf1 subunit/transcription initiation factor TFIIB
MAFKHITSGNSVEVRDDDACDTKLCRECGTPSLRIKPTEGTLACIDCGLVEQSNIIDMTKETRNFASENRTSNQIERTGDLVRIDQLNSLVTEFRGGGKNSGAFKMNTISARTPGEQQIISQRKRKDWYYDYFRNMKRTFRLK